MRLIFRKSHSFFFKKRFIFTSLFNKDFSMTFYDKLISSFHNISFWWRCRELNPGPECVHVASTFTCIIYTISYALNIPNPNVFIMCNNYDTPIRIVKGISSHFFQNGSSHSASYVSGSFSFNLNGAS